MNSPIQALANLLNSITSSWGTVLEAGIAALERGDIDHANVVLARLDDEQRRMVSILTLADAAIDAELLVHTMFTASVPCFDRFVLEASVANGWSVAFGN